MIRCIGDPNQSLGNSKIYFTSLGTCLVSCFGDNFQLLVRYETRAIWTKVRTLLADRFPEFSYGKIIILSLCYLLSLWAFAVSFSNGGSTKSKDFSNRMIHKSV